MDKDSVQFDVALSFAGEDRKYVEEVAVALRDMGLRIFYDKYEVVSLWGKDLYTHLSDIYEKRSGYTVMFISENYADKLWTNHERKSAQSRAFKESREYILPCRFDNTEVPGLTETIGYIDLTNIKPYELAGLIKDKIGPISRYEFFPSNPDRLFEVMTVTSNEDKVSVQEVAEHFFQDLTEMTIEERLAVAEVFKRTCPAGPPENVHVRIDLLERLLSRSKNEIIALFSRLDCLGLVAKINQEKKEDDSLCQSYEVLEVRYYHSGVADDEDNATDVVIAIFQCIYDHLCPDCATSALERIDLSILGVATGFPDKQVNR